MSRNKWNLSVYDDDRKNTEALGITWDTSNVVLKNNSFPNNDGSASELIHTDDYNQPDERRRERHARD